jgi:hypothetical protein
MATSGGANRRIGTPTAPTPRDTNTQFPGVAIQPCRVLLGPVRTQQRVARRRRNLPPMRAAAQRQAAAFQGCLFAHVRRVRQQKRSSAARHTGERKLRLRGHPLWGRRILPPTHHARVGAVHTRRCAKRARRTLPSTSSWCQRRSGGRDCPTRHTFHPAERCASNAATRASERAIHARRHKGNRRPDRARRVQPHATASTPDG